MGLVVTACDTQCASKDCTNVCYVRCGVLNSLYASLTCSQVAPSTCTNTATTAAAATTDAAATTAAAATTVAAATYAATTSNCLGAVSSCNYSIVYTDSSVTCCTGYTCILFSTTALPLLLPTVWRYLSQMLNIKNWF